MKRTSLIIVSAMATLFSMAHAAEGENLLKNPGIELDANGIPNWKISEASIDDLDAFAQKARWEAVEEPDGNCLTIATKEPMAANVWWQQDLKGIGGATYEVRVEIKGALQPRSKYGGVTIGIHFLGADGQWLGFEPIRFPISELSDTWTTVKGKITAPADGVHMGFRLGIMVDGEMEVFFKNPSLAEVL
jgi:hypothetical protein